MPEEPEKRKLRGLFIVRVDNLFDESHPLWETIQEHKKLLDETHVLIFSSKRVTKRKMFMEYEPGLYFYRFSMMFALFRFLSAWRMLGFNFYWRHSFRADFIMSFTAGTGGLFGYILAKRFKRPIFFVTSLRAVQGGMLARYLLRHATKLFVPGPYNAKTLGEKLGIRDEKLVPLPPPVDRVALRHVTERFNFNRSYPSYNFFLCSCVGSITTLRTVLDIHKKVAAKYPRVGLVIIAERNRYDRLRRRLGRKSAKRGVFLYKLEDDYLSLIAGAQIYLAVPEEGDDIDTALLSALGLGVPSIAYRSSAIDEMFSGSPFERYVCERADTERPAKEIIELIEHSSVRDGYALNTAIVFKKFPYQDTASHVGAAYRSIEATVTPAKQGESAGKMYLRDLGQQDREYALKTEGK